ncbi:MAG: glutamate-1-semialdehyde 2,1-aminomutase [Aureliella sp.]
MYSYSKSRALQERVHRVIPGGCHTYAKGDDQYPLISPAFIERGEGCHVWDVDGNEFIEYGMGCRGVSLGHAFAPITEAVQNELQFGTNFSRPARVELECAEMLLDHIGNAEMCKFAKEGSTVTTTAVKFARAFTNRNLVAICADQPFFSIHDWSIGTTTVDAGIPAAVRDLSVTFRYNDLDHLNYVFNEHPRQIAAVIMEAAKYEDPDPGYLNQVKEVCRRHGAIFILDEMITGFRWHSRGAQHLYDVVPDLSTFGKALANGFSASALIGRRDLMEQCGIYHERERVFALSTTHGAETHSLRAVMATIEFYQENPVVEQLENRGSMLAQGILDLVKRLGLQEYVRIVGRPSCLVFGTQDADRKPSQEFRALLMQELIRNGVLGPSLVVSYSHSVEDIHQTIQAFDAALQTYGQALEHGVARYLVGPPTQTVYRKFNSPAFTSRVEVPQ